MNVSDINKNQCILKQSIDEAIYRSISFVHRRTTKPEEPDYIASLSTLFAKKFFRILKKNFPGYSFSVSSVFCHQKPIVKFYSGSSKKGAELGDILFVYKDENKNGEVKLNSLLLQAKVNKTGNPWLKVHKDDKHQLYLYKNWPEFTYDRAGDLNGQERNIFPKTITDGAQYLIINKDPLKIKYEDYLICDPCLGIKCDPFCRIKCNPFCRIKPFSMYCAVPDDVLYYNESLSNELINMLKFKSGRTFDVSQKDTEDEWSKMIWDLLKILSESSSKRKNIEPKPFKRCRTYNCFRTEYMTGKTLLDAFMNEDNEDTDVNDKTTDDEESVMSVILIESKQNEQYEG